MRESSSAACSDGGDSNDGAEKRANSREPTSVSAVCSGTSSAPLPVERSGFECVRAVTGAPAGATAGAAADGGCW